MDRSSVDDTPYRWLHRLGSGSSGVVYAAERDGAEIAVKMLRARPGTDHAEAIRREMKLGPLLADHPGIVAVRRVDGFEGGLYLEMDWVRGPSLEQVIEGRGRAGRGPIPAPVVLRWAVQVMETLQWAGEAVAPDSPASFVHRDIKPANLLLDPSGRVRITDFGIARAEAELGFLTTHSGVVKGSPRFMAPEILLDRAVDWRADQFSLGVVMYELLTGMPLYRGRDLAEILMQALASDVETRLAVLHAPKDLVAVLRRMLSKSPGDRFPTPDAAATALASLQVPGPAVEDLLPELLGYVVDEEEPEEEEHEPAPGVTTLSMFEPTGDPDTLPIGETEGDTLLDDDLPSGDTIALADLQGDEITSPGSALDDLEHTVISGAVPRIAEAYGLSPGTDEVPLEALGDLGLEVEPPLPPAPPAPRAPRDDEEETFILPVEVVEEGVAALAPERRRASPSPPPRRVRPARSPGLSAAVVASGVLVAALVLAGSMLLGAVVTLWWFG